MPTYQYACTECSHSFDQFQRFTDDPLTECPQCAGRLRKVFGAVGVVFKGSGFYRTDSRAAGKGATDGSPKAPTDGAGSGSSGAKDTPGGAAAKDASGGAPKPETKAAAPA